MNKNILFGAAAILFCGYFALVSFKGKTKEQQMQEITAAVETKISDLRASKATECETRVMVAAQIKFDSIQTAAAEAAAAAAAGKKGVTKKVTKKKTTTKASTPTTTTRIDPVPSTPPPPAPPKTKVDEKVESRRPTPAGTVKDAAEKAKEVNDKVKSRRPGGGGK